MCCDQGSKAYYVSLGCFHDKSFTIKQQLTEPSLVKKFSLRLPQQSFSENLASLSFDYHEDTQTPSKKKLDTTTNNFSGDGSQPEVNLLDTACRSSNVDETFVNYKNILQSHLIDSIVKDGVDSSLFWSLVDLSKLASGVKSFMSAIQKQRSMEEAKRLSSVNIPEENIELPEGLKFSAFSTLSKHGVPLIVSSIHALLHGIY
jgi:hypothetical protein